MIQRGINLVYGGGGVGLMGIIAATLRDSTVTVTGTVAVTIVFARRKAKDYEVFERIQEFHSA